MLHLKLSSYGLPPRQSIRPLDQRQPDYDELFDSETFIYDAFVRDGAVFIIAPPLTQDAWQVLLGGVSLNGKPVHAGRMQVLKGGKTHKLIIRGIKGQVSLFEHSLRDVSRECAIPLGRGRVLYTLQKNNEISWIRDWISWHVRSHACEHVIIYDNGSDQYDLDELRRKLGIAGCDVHVFSAPFRYGPGAFNGSAWDSDFLQYAMFEHVRYRHCGQKTQLLQVDIDELVFVASRMSVYELADLPASINFFSGRWIEMCDEEGSRPISHTAHSLVDLSSACPNKWIANLEGLPDTVFFRVHDSEGQGAVVRHLLNVKYLHFRSINTNWKWKRRRMVKFDKEKHAVVEWDRENLPEKVF